MNWTVLEGKWEQAEAKMRQKWSKLTNDDIGLIRGKNQELVGRLRERYGWSKDETEQRVDSFLSELGGGGERRRKGGNGERQQRPR